MAIYMKIDGVDGNVTSKGFEKTIEVDSVNFNVARSMTTQPGSVANREGTKPAFSEISIERHIDEASPLLFGKTTVGTNIPSVTFNFVKTDNDLVNYCTVTLSDVMVSGYGFDSHRKSGVGAATGAAQNGQTVSSEHPRELLKLNYTKMEVKYTPYDKQNNAGTPIASGYDLEQAQAC